MSSINFDNAWLLFIALPLIVLICVPFFISVRKDNRNGHNIASGALHVLMAVLIAFAAAGTTIETVMTETNVYVLADVSYSSSRNLDVIDGYITKLEGNLPKNSKMGVICFGKDQQVNTRLGEDFSTVKDSGVDDSQTDIVGALDYVSGIFRNGVIKRVVIITDGKQTDTSSSNALKLKVDELLAEGIYVDAIYLDNNISSDAREVQVTSVDYGDTVYKNQSATATALIQSTYTTSTAASVTLSLEGDVIDRVSVMLSAGANTVDFTLSSSREAGVYNYEITVTAEEDENPYNNTCAFTQKVEGAMNVLFITDEEDDAVSARSLFSSIADLDIYAGDADIPYSVADLCTYDMIILSNVDMTGLNNYKTFIDNLETVVSGLGKSLIGIGDLHLQSATDEYLLKLADMLPVNYGDGLTEGRLYTIVIDASDSMYNYNKMDIAKSAAKQLVNLLDDDDYLCIVTFYGEIEITLPVTKISMYGRDKIEATIDDVYVKQGTMISYALEEALNQMKNYTYNDQQVLLITDGLNSSSDVDDDELAAIAAEIFANGISLSVLDVGRGGDTTSNEAVNAVARLNLLAQQGGGSYWLCTSETQLDGTIFTDIADSMGNAVVERTSSVRVSRYYDSVLKGVKAASMVSSSNTLGSVGGYVNSTAKASATTVLTALYQKTETAYANVPIYSYWNYGDGKTAAFTSSLSGDWISSWESNGIAAVFFADMLTQNIPDEKTDSPFTVTITEDSGLYELEIAPVEIKLDATVTVTVTTVNDAGEESSFTVSNVLFDSSVYTCSFTLTEVGTYSVEVTYDYRTDSYVHSDYITLSYLSEYNSFQSYNASTLYRMLGSNGTVSEDGNLVVENDEDSVGVRIIYLTLPLMIAAVVLFAADIIIRKLKWNDIKNLFVKVNKANKENKS